MASSSPAPSPTASPRSPAPDQRFNRASLPEASGPEGALQAHADHEHRGEERHLARGVEAGLVVDPRGPVALQAAEGLLDLPAPWLELEALAARRADEFGTDT